jgi:glycosyltransferase involved in cell wall biosynthesis
MDARAEALQNLLDPQRGSLMFPSLPIEPSGSETRAARVCIATYEILGPSQNGGIGTAYYSLATSLAGASHQVTILYLTGAPWDEAEMRHWETHFRTLGIAFVPLPVPPRMAVVPNCMLTACDAHAWLRKQQFNIIHFPELRGHGYYCALAKHQGLDFNHTTLCIGTHSPISWIREQNKEAPYSPEELEMDFMERQCVALADVVVSPSQYMLNWMRRRGWVLPPACYVQQNIAPPELQTFADLKRRRGVARADEMVFFGRLEARKGIGLFCDAVDLLMHANFADFSVTFLGKNGLVAGLDAVTYIRARSENWGVPCRILTDHGRDAALRFLSEDDGRVAVIPSFEDNLPNTVMECLAGGIPFLASGTGGIPELIARADVERVTFAPEPSRLADSLARAMQEGVSVARPSIDAGENRQRWINWHASLACHSDNNRRPAGSVSSPGQPLVTVCLNHRGESDLLQQSLRSLRRQTYPKLEVLLSDHSAAGAEAELYRAMQDFESKGWRLVRRGETDGGSAGTDATADARGQYVLFMDVPDYLNPDAVATFVKVANETGANVLTCFLAPFTGAQEPNEETGAGRYPFLSGAILSGVFCNRFGLRIVFVQRDALLSLGGFPEHSQRDSADWEFLARAALMQCRMEVIPIPLAWYRIQDESGPHVPIDYPDQLRAVAPYTEAMPDALRELPKAALTMSLHYQKMCERLGDNQTRTILQRLSANRKSGNRASVLADEGALLLTVKEMPARVRKKIGSVLDGWVEYSSARSQLPPPGFQRISHIARQLVRGHYHRYAHGFGSALRDLRRPSPPSQQKG